ncbi:hypothetical protein AWC38_SpisGene22581 [Stylophora pistillata]|uniref:C2H2-type domain-containing protein n=1 Tax=Stylophora pistillata TaxID=50429 RepID=A0A2B4RA19_STYPI|nr:hypothetical protein AWC38_SpisGene22581 [Stylophora pistillata]
MRIYINAGNDIETPEQVRDTILSSGGVPGVNVALCETVQVPTVLSSKIEGSSQRNNVEYKEDGLLVWRAYGISDGKLILTDKLHCPSLSDLPTPTGVTRSYSSAFTSVKERRIKASVRDEDPPVHIEEEESNARIFSCPEEGCVKTFVRYSSMQRHLDCGKHQRALERYTILDRAAAGYAQSEGSGEGQLRYSKGLSVDFFGNLIVCDVRSIDENFHSGILKMFTLDGTFLTSFGKDRIKVPWIVSSCNNGDLLVADILGDSAYILGQPVSFTAK